MDATVTLTEISLGKHHPFHLQVDNLGPPWGNCSSKKLKHYDVYSVNTCIMSCKMELAHKRCGCIDIDMPYDGGSISCRGIA